jgi:hypothetical protein
MTFESLRSFSTWIDTDWGDAAFFLGLRGFLGALGELGAAAFSFGIVFPFP